MKTCPCSDPKHQHPNGVCGEIVNEVDEICLKCQGSSIQKEVDYD